MKVDLFLDTYDIPTEPVTAFLNKLKKDFKKKNQKKVRVVTKKTINFIYGSKAIKSFKSTVSQETFLALQADQIIDKTVGLYEDILNQIKKKTKKRKVVHSRKVELGPEELWTMITNVEEYPKYIKYMQASKLHGKFDVGAHWSDISTVMFYPMRIKHEIVDIKEGKEVTFLIKLPLGGKIVQKGIIEDKGDYVSMSFEATIDLGHPLVDITLGPILEKRTKQMFKGSLKKGKQEF